MRRLFPLLIALFASPTLAEILPPPEMDIYVLGEVHDNPAHHAEQARLIGLIAPKTVVWEMLSPEQAAAIAGLDLTDQAALGAGLDWENSGWPDFAMYHPIFVAAPEAQHEGGTVPRGDLRKAIEEGVEVVLGSKAEDWHMGPLAAAEQAAREEDQRLAHCNALPEAMLPGMVEAQRLRDFAMADLAAQAVAEGRGPVVVITGSGHARKDWGVPALLAKAMPELKVWSLGQNEGPLSEGPFDAQLTAPAPEREDPCLAFSG